MFDGTKIHQVRPAEFGRDKMQKVSLEELYWSSIEEKEWQEAFS